MLKKLIIATAASALMAGTAAAQQASPPAKAPTAPPPAASQPAPAAPETKATPAPKAQDMTNAPAAAKSAPTFVNTQGPDQLLFSSFNGTDVVGADDKKIGDVSDILFDKSGKVEAYVVGVGGFLGIGSKNVALAPSAFQVVPGDKSKNESDKLRLSMTKDQLEKAASFEPRKEQRTTTGMGGGTTPRTAPGGTPR